MTTADPAPADDALRAALKGIWASAAGAWGEHAAATDARAAALTERMLDLIGLEEGERLVELAGGPGGGGIAAARRVGPSGSVLISDLVPEMTEIAARRARDAGLGNVETAALDLEQIDQPDASFDAAICRDGLMLVADPRRAAGEVARIVRPGGRAAFAVWGPRARNPWLGLVLDAVSEQLGAPVPPPGMPGPFSLEDRDELAGVLRDGGFGEVEVTEVEVPTNFGSFEEWWARVTALAGPVANLLSALPPEAVEQLRERLRASAAEFETTAGGYELPGVGLVGVARRV
jgi:SAM-dependent methyltransferase